MYILIKNHNHDFSFRTSCMAWTLSTSKEILHWEWGYCMHFYWVKECTHEILVGFLFFIFTLLLTLQANIKLVMFIFINSAFKFASKGNINQGGKFWNILNHLHFSQSCFLTVISMFSWNYGLYLYVHAGRYTQTRKRLKNYHLAVYISLSQ